MINCSYKNLNDLEEEPTNILQKNINIKGTGIQLTIDNNICVICHEEENENTNDHLILYQHGCGDYYVHQKCLEKWYKKEGYECLICREKILDEENNTGRSITESNINLDNSNRQQYIGRESNNSNRNTENNNEDDNCCLDDQSCISCGKISCFICIIGSLFLFLK